MNIFFKVIEMYRIEIRDARVSFIIKKVEILKDGFLYEILDPVIIVRHIRDLYENEVIEFY